MIRLFELLWHGCWHSWKPITTRKVNWDHGVTEVQVVYQCNKCNRYKAIEL